MKQTVCIVEDEQPIRQSLMLLLKSHGIAVREYTSAEEFLAEREANWCGCLLLNLSLPGMNGLELQNMLHNNCDNTPVIFVSGHGDIPSAVGAVKSGAIDFLPKPFSDEELVTRIRDAFQQSEEMHQCEIKNADYLSRLQSLTKREKEILDFVVEGLSSKEIARQLSLSYRTIESHRSRIMKKMATSSLRNLVAKVLSSKSDESVP